MSKKEATQVEDKSTTKSPRTVTVQVIVPWIIVMLLITGVTGLIAGWFIHANAMSEVTAQVNQVVALKK